MDAGEDVNPLIPLALEALAQCLGMDPETLPGSVEGVLRHFGIACHEAGWDRAHDEPTIRTKTDPSMALPVLKRGKDSDE